MALEGLRFVTALLITRRLPIDGLADSSNAPCVGSISAAVACHSPRLRSRRRLRAGSGLRTGLPTTSRGANAIVHGHLMDDDHSAAPLLSSAEALPRTINQDVLLREETPSSSTAERRAKQARAIRRRKPWTRSTGPRTSAGKAQSSRNAYRGGLRPLLRQLARGLKLMDETLADHAHCR